MKIRLSDHFTYGRLLKFVAPSVVMLVFTSVYSIVDGLFISNFVGETAVAATNIVFPLIIILGAVGFMLGSGGSALVAKTLGEGDGKRANEYFSVLVYFTSAAGIAIMVAGEFLTPLCVKLLAHTDSGELYDYCVLYGRILLAGQPFFILQNMFQSFFVTAEKPRLGLLVTVGAGVMNMALDAVLVAGFKLGLSGAAWATFASQVFGGVAPVFYFARKNSGLLKLTRTKFYFGAVVKSATNGASEFLSNVSAAVVMLLYNEQLMNLAGEEGVAAYAAIAYVSMIFFSMFMGFAVGCVPVLGYNFGAGNRDELKSLFKKSLLIVAATGVLMTGLAELTAVPIVNLFGYGKNLREITLNGHRLYSLSYLVGGYGVLGSALFTALNNGLVSGIISFVRTIVLKILSILIMPAVWGLNGVWVSSAVSEFVALIVTASFIFAYRKRYGYF